MQHTVLTPSTHTSFVCVSTRTRVCMKNRALMLSECRLSAIVRAKFTIVYMRMTFHLREKGAGKDPIGSQTLGKSTLSQTSSVALGTSKPQASFSLMTP